jgi:predicted O-methyltransferase YrrM
MISELKSSYNTNRGGVPANYGNFFYGLTTLVNPRLMVEIGVCEAYSTVHFAKAIKDCDMGGQLHCYDLWSKDEEKTNFHEEQKGKHLTSNHNKFTETLKKYNLQDVVTFEEKEAFSVLSKYPDASVDMIHVDIGNCGDVLEKMITDVTRALRKNGYFLFEGGAAYRDNVKWMKEFNKAPINPALNHTYVSEYFQFITFDEYPSLTLGKKL